MATLTSSNRAKPEEIASFVDEYERFEREKATIMAEAMKKCATVSDKQVALLDDAKDKGWAKKVLKDAVKIRKLESKLRALMVEQEQDTAADLDKLLKSLGGFAELPLGMAAVKAADSAKKTPEQEAERNKALDAAIKSDEASKGKPKKDAQSDEFYDSQKKTPQTVQ